MTDAVQTILDIADGGVKYRTEKLPRVKIRQQSPMPSLTLIGIIAVAFILIVCLLSTVQLFRMKSDIYKMREQRTEMKESISELQSLAASEKYVFDAVAPYDPENQ